MASKTSERAYLAWALVGAAVLAFGLYRMRAGSGDSGVWSGHNVVGGVRYGADGKPFDASMDFWA